MNEYICRKEEVYLVYNWKMDKIHSYNDIQEVYKVCAEENIPIIENSPTQNSFSFPFKLFLDISNYCNLNCIHCLSESSSNNGIFLSEELIKKTIYECCQHGIFQIKIGGGEPLLYPNFWNIVNTIRSFSSAVRISFSTNGSIIKEEDIENIKKYNCNVSVSIDGNYQIHNFIRKHNIYDRVMQSVDLMIDREINPIIRYTLMDLNINCFMEVYNYCQQKGLQLKVRRYKPTSAEAPNLLTYGKEYYNLVKILRTLPDCDIEDIMKDTIDNDKILYCADDCGAAFRSIHVDCFGNVSPCVFLGNQYRIGNIKCDSIKFLWDNSKILKDLRKTDRNYQCTQCKRKYICHGECLGVRLFYDKHIWGADKGCLLRGN